MYNGRVHDPRAILERVHAGRRITAVEATVLLQSDLFQEIGRAADAVRRRLHPDGIVTFLIDRNINYTNVCVARCTFCNFYRRPRNPEGYLLSHEEIFRKIEETIELGGTGILMQGGMNPDLKIEYYEELLRAIRSRYPIHLHCFSPPEIVVLARLSKLSLREAIRRLKAAGLDSIPGGGAEILTDRMRRRISPGKCSADEWLEVMRIAHEEGLNTTATMMFGAGETVEEIAEHLDRIRTLQDRTGGFVAFIPWNVQLEGTEMQAEIREKVSPIEYLKLLAVSRIYLDNIPNIQVSWLTQGLEVAQIALHFGANDVGSIMIEENVISTAGSHRTATRQDLVRLIEQAGFRPAQRDTLYRRAVPVPA
ncbi:MAG: cyclic dehypoxanthinyl futalosine synthase [Acidobacteriota bacterium]